MRTERPRRHKPAWAQALVAAGVVIALTALYLGLMRLAVDSTRISDVQTADDRDLVQLAIHGGVLAGSALAGFAIGKWLNGLGLAYAVLVSAAVMVLMITALVGSQALACEGGHNDLIRHWTC